MSRFGKILGAYPSTTSRAHNHNVGLNNMWSLASGEFQEIVLVMFARFVVIGYFWESRESVKIGASFEPEILANECHLLVNSIQRW